MDVVTTYLYGDLDKDVYVMKIPKELCNSMQFGKFRNPSIKLCKSLYGLQHAGINIALNIFFVIDFIMIIFVLPYLSSIITENLSASLFVLVI